MGHKPPVYEREWPITHSRGPIRVDRSCHKLRIFDSKTHPASSLRAVVMKEHMPSNALKWVRTQNLQIISRISYQ